MRIMKLWRIAFMVLAVFSIASCSKEDGDWDPMKWKAEVPVKAVDGTYNVSADGGTFKFSCRNYSSIWFVGAKDIIENESYRAELKGNVLTIEFMENEDPDVKHFTVSVRSGDAFYDFVFKQSVSAAWRGTYQLKYSIFAISDDMRQFYDIAADYFDIDGQQCREVITGDSWYYTSEKVGIADIPAEFKCRIVASLKENLPELTENYFKLEYGIDVHASFFKADGEEAFTIKQPQLLSTFTCVTDRSGMRQFLESTPEIEISSFSPTISKPDIFSKLK